MLFKLIDEPRRQNAIEAIKGLNLAEKWEVEIVPSKKKKRSNPQNRLYFANIRILAHHFGYPDEEMHEILAGKFLGYKEIEFRGELRVIRISTTSLTKEEFSEYLNKVLALGMNEGLKMILPDDLPEDLWSR